MKKQFARKQNDLKHIESNDYLFRMSHASDEKEDTGIFILLPAVFFSAFVILIVRMYSYTRPMGQFFWTSQTDASPLVDFFSYYKMVAIILCTALVFILLLYKITSQSLAVKRTYAYVPMIVYALFVLLSYALSDYKAFAWLGWNDRFEGSLILLCYMVMLFFIINMVKTERDIRAMVGAIAASSFFLSLLGISQALSFDFFQTRLGQKLLVANTPLANGATMWESIDAAAEKGQQFLSFTFQNKQIYQTVYNINYVSFYLTLLIPLFGMLFILAFNKGKDEALFKKAGLAALFALLIYNLIGSASSGGFLGLGVIGLAGIVVLNKKLLQWTKPLLILLVITGLVASITAGRWLPEITGAAKSVLGTQTQAPSPAPTGPEDLADLEPNSVKPTIDFIKTGTESIELSINGQMLTVQLGSTDATGPPLYTLFDGEGKEVGLEVLQAAGEVAGDSQVYAVNDKRFKPYLTLQTSKIGDYHCIVMTTGTTQWRFPITQSGIYYLNRMGKAVNLYDVPHFGFEDNPNFGSWRGYIWSRSFPLLKNSLIIGTGADTYCGVFPQEDYAGKYSTSNYNNLDIVVDKPHNMYLHAWIGTGGISLLALLALYGIYLFQSFVLYRKIDFGKSYLTFVGAGIFFGITGFLVSALVNDSSVSVMPMFYGLLGIGIAVNGLVKGK